MSTGCGGSDGEIDSSVFATNLDHIAVGMKAGLREDEICNETLNAELRMTLASTNAASVNRTTFCHDRTLLDWNENV